MNLALPDNDRLYSREEFRRWCEAQPKGRYERVDGHIVGIAPERGAHLRAKGSIYRALVRAVAAAGVPCQALPDGVTVETGDSDYEPDALVNCGPPMADDAVAAPNPVVVVEVLSPGTTSTDTGGKLAGYFRVPSIVHYLIVHPTRRNIIYHRWTSDGIGTRIVVNGSIVMDPPGIAIAVEDIYAADWTARYLASMSPAAAKLMTAGPAQPVQRLKCALEHTGGAAGSWLRRRRRRASGRQLGRVTAAHAASATRPGPYAACRWR